MVVPTSTEFQKALITPLEFIQTIFEKKQSGPTKKNDPIDFVQEVQNEFSTLFKSNEARLRIPFLNDKTKEQNIETSSSSSHPQPKLVRWRCMIQDTNLGNEVLPSQLCTRDGKKLNGLFGASSNVNETLDPIQQNDGGFSSLITLCGVSLPAQSDWSREVDEGRNSTSTSTSAALLSDKLPRGEGSAILLKLYDEDLAEKLQVTQIVDVLGILDQSSLPNSDWTQMGSGGEQDESAKPATVYPTLHVISLENDRQSAASNVNDSVDLKAKEEIITALEQSLGGDRLAAEWILLAICARIHTRSAAHILGSLSVNISGFPSSSSPNLLATLRSILPFVADQSLDLNHLNAPTTKFSPQSDADEKGLRSGRLQLVRNTCLFIDESTMNEGQLRENGINNIRSLSTVLQTQKLAYSFPFSQHEMESELQCIVVSQGKSFLPIDVQIPWQGTSTLSTNQENGSLTNWRNYLQNVQKRSSPASLFTIPNEISEKIQDDFVETRKLNQNLTSIDAKDTKDDKPLTTLFSTQEDLARIIQVARLICLTNGENSLRWQDWQEAKRLEQERLQRMDGIVEKV